MLFDAKGNAKLIDEKHVTCPLSKMSDSNGVIVIRCYVENKYEVIRIVASGWKSKGKSVLFGFQYWLHDPDYTLGKSETLDHNNLSTYGGLPTSLVKQK